MQQVKVYKIQVNHRLTNTLLSDEIVTIIYDTITNSSRCFSTAERIDYYVMKFKGQVYNKEELINRLMLRKYNSLFKFDIVSEQEYELGNTLIVPFNDGFKIIKTKV